MFRSCLTAALLIAAATSPALAVNGVCRGFNFQNDLHAVGLYEIAEQDRTHFIKGWSSQLGDRCPSLSPACHQPSFLIENDKVVVNEFEGEFACANYVDRKGNDVSGWLPRAALSKVEVEPRWEGRWSTYNGRAVITIRSDPRGPMLVRGKATYNTGSYVNTGEFVVEGDSGNREFSFGYYSGSQMTYEQAFAGPKRCAARIRQLGPYLAVIDNDACGGENVSFTGLYTRN